MFLRCSPDGKHDVMGMCEGANVPTCEDAHVKT